MESKQEIMQKVALLKETKDKVDNELVIMQIAKNEQEESASLAIISDLLYHLSNEIDSIAVETVAKQIASRLFGTDEIKELVEATRLQAKKTGNLADQIEELVSKYEEKKESEVKDNGNV